MRKKIRKTIIKSAAAISIFTLIFSADAASALFVDFNAGSKALDGMNAVMGDLKVVKSELQNTIGMMNVARFKKQQPQVSLTFEPANPVNGQKVTAIATPTYFMNDQKNLYFTWYLQEKDCGPDDSPSGEEKERCNLNDDKKIDEEDYKIKAARILVNNGFEWENADYSKSDGKSSYNASFGGDDQRGKPSYCYVHDTVTGVDKELTEGCDKHLFAEAPDHDTGDGKYGKDEEEFFRTDPEDQDTADTGNGDEANVAGLGINKFSWVYQEGDKIGVVVEGISVDATQHSDSSYKIMWALLKNKCDLDFTLAGYPKATSVLIPSSVTISNFDGGEVITNWDNDTPPIGGPALTDNTKNLIGVTQTETSVVAKMSGSSARIETTGVVKYTFSDKVTQEVSETTANLTRSLSYTTAEGVPVSSYAYSQVENITFNDLNTSVTNIKKSSDINKCLISNMIDPHEGGGIAEKMEVSLDYSPANPINDTSAKGNYPSGTAINELLEGEGSEISIRANVINAQHPEFLTYTWQLYQSDDPNPDSWGNQILKEGIPGATQTSGIGLDTFKFKLNFPSVKKFLRAKVTITENVSSSRPREGHGEIVIPVSSTNKKIKVYNTKVEGEKLKLENTQRCDKGFDSTLCRVAKNEIVGLKVENPGNELIDFLWSINGEPLSHQTCFFEGCKENKQSNIAFFPVIDENGYQYAITISATNQKTGEKINLSKNFEVNDPAVEIISADSQKIQPELLGYYVDNEEKLWEDYSENNFLALADVPLKLKPNFIGYDISQDYYYWIVDGTRITKDNFEEYGFTLDPDGTLTLPGRAAGETYTVSVEALYTQDPAKKKILNEYWGVSLTNFYETTISSTISIEIRDSLPDAGTAMRQEPKIMANMLAAAPSYFLFLLRIILTIFVILIVTRGILSFSPEISGIYGKTND